LVANNTEGIYFEASPSNEISGNRIVFNGNMGIQLDDCVNNSVTYNYIAHSKKGYIMNRGGSNTFSGNTVIYTQEKGLHIGESTDNIVSGNHIAWSRGYALTISGNLGNNSIHHNNFVNNAACDPHQGYPGAYTPNTWDNGYEGNFWSDYQEKYPTGKETALGTWDTPVAMNANNTDRFPLIAPVSMKYQVTVLQPANAFYNANLLPISFLTTGPVSWMAYSLDANPNVTINGDFLLDGLSHGVHSITVYAGKESGSCASETVFFGITQNSSIPSTQKNPNPSPTNQPTTTPKPAISPSPFLDTSPAPTMVSPTQTLAPTHSPPFPEFSAWILAPVSALFVLFILTFIVIHRRAKGTEL
jgi:parallel beta-helix repeat protein